MNGIGEHIFPENNKVSLHALLVSVALLVNPLSTLNIGGFGLFFLVFVPLFIALLWKLLQQSNQIRWNSSLTFLLIFFVYCLFAFVWSPSQKPLDLLQIIVLFFSVALPIFSKKEQEVIKKSAVISLVITCCLVYISATGIQEDGRASITVFGVERDPNYVSLLFFPGFAFLSKMLFDNVKFSRKLLAFALILLTLYSELRMGTRGGAFTCLFILGLSFLLFGKLSMRSIIVAVILLLLLMFLFPLVMNMLPEMVSHRFEKEMVSGDDFGDRMWIWISIKRLMFDEVSVFHFLFGYGTQSTVSIVGMAAHNFVLQYFFEGGLVGVTILFVFIIKFVKMTIKSKEILSLVIFAGSFFMALELSIAAIAEFWINIAISFALMSPARAVSEYK